MNPPQPELKAIFCKALDHPAGPERSAYLDGACGDDVRLRDQVESILQAHDVAGGFLGSAAEGLQATQNPAPEATRDHTPEPDEDRTVSFHSSQLAEGPGTLIGPYKLLQKIGEGGMGVVYMAEQEKPVRRMVALKIIKPGMDTAQVIARFESERQALAIMDHPNIAKVLDAGATASGRPFFAMELVKGVPITEFCDKNHMPAERRLKLFVDVCHAIQHAHHKGIIHRDIKPSNVMVTLHDGTPVPKVIDFGVAKATVQKLTERTLFTAYGQMIGTPAYMSPEQAEMSGLDIDTRSDVYSLGVLLYELLTGTTPLESKHLRAAGYAEIQRLIREEEPPRPSTRLSFLGESATVLAGNRGSDVKKLSSLLAGDLDWIVMKALAKERDRRYDTPANFAQDIDRYQRQEAIQARPPSTAYKLKKLAQRNRAAVLTIAAVALALLGGTAAATWQAVRAIRAEHLAIDERDRARKADTEAKAQRDKALVEKERADKNFALARKAVEDYLTRVSDDPELKDRTDFTSLRKRLLESALPFYEQFGSTLGDDPGSDAERARVLVRLAGVRIESGEWSEAVKAGRQARDAYARAVEASPTSFVYRAELVSCTNSLAYAQYRVHEPSAAKQTYHEAVRLADLLVADFPNQPDAHFRRACVYFHGDSFGEERFDEAIRELRELTLEHPTVEAYHSMLAGALGNAASVRIQAGQWQKAEAAYRESIEIERHLCELQPNDPERRHDLANILFNHGAFIHNTRPAEALPLRQEASTLLRKLVQDFPSNVRFRHMLARNQNAVGLLLARFRRPEEAVEALREAVLLMRQLPQDYPHPHVRRWRLADFTKDLAFTLESAGRKDESSGYVNETMALLIDAPSLLKETNFDVGVTQTLCELLRLHVTPEQVARVVAEITEATKTDTWSAGHWYNFACINAISSTQDAARSDEYATRALELLRKAVEAGWKDLEHMKRDRDLDPLRDRGGYQKLVSRLEAADTTMLALDARLAAVIGGEVPKDDSERVTLAQRAYDTKRFGAAARLWGEAVDANPTLANDRQAQRRYNAACAAALATKTPTQPSFVEGECKTLDDARKAKLRRQALEWLQAELAAWTKVFDTGPDEIKALIVPTLEHWKVDADLAPLRDETELSELPEEERADLVQLWSDVDQLLTRANRSK